MVKTTTGESNDEGIIPGDVTITGTLTVGQIIGAGIVSSVAMTVPTFLSIAGSPITSSGTLAVSLSGVPLPIINGGTGTTTSTGTGSTVLSNSPVLSGTVSVPNINVRGATSGIVTVQPQSNAGTYNLNLPITAGTSGQLLTSGGGTSAPMTWTNPNTNVGTVTSVAMNVPTFLSVSGSPITSSGTFAVTLSGTPLPVLNGGTGTTTSTGTGSIVLSTSPTFSGTPIIPTLSTSNIQYTGATSGVISVLPQSVAGTYNLNLPTTAGTTGQVLTSGGGVGAPMTWTTPASPGTGTVTSVGLTMPAWLTVSNSPVTTSGTIAVTGSKTGTGSTVVLNVSPTFSTSFKISGSSSGLISLLTQAASGTYNWNYPITVGTAGQVLTSQAGGSTAMTWTTPTTGTVTSIDMTVPSFLSISGSPITTSGTLALTLSGTALPVLNGGTGTTTSTGTGSTVLSVSPTFTGTITLPIISTSTININGSSSGTISILPQAVAGTYNFNLPTTAGTNGQVLTSAGGVSAPMVWTTPGTGTVTSIGMSVPSFLSVAGSPITTSGTLAVTLSGTALPVLNGGTGTTTSTGTGSVVLNISPTLTSASNLIASPPLLITNTSSSTGGYMSTKLYPNLPAGVAGFMYENFGVAQSSGNSFVSFFHYEAASSALNYLGWSGWGDNENLRMYTTGQVSLPTNIASTSVTTGSFISAGGAGINGAVSALSINLQGSSSGLISLLTQAASGTYNWNYPTTAGTSGQVLTSAGGIAAPMTWTTPTTGTVTSVAMTVPSFLSVAGSPITTSGTLAVTLSGTALPVLNGGTGTTTSTGTGSVVLSASPTFTGTVTTQTLNATINSSTTSGAMNLVNNSATTPYLSTQLAPNLPLGGIMYQNFGVAQVAGDSFVNYFNYAGGNGSGLNFLGWSGWGDNENMRMYTTGETNFPTFISTPSIKLTGSTSGVISILPQAVAGTYNWNLPTTAGTSGYVLTSAGGGSSPMTWTSLAAAGLGTVTSVDMTVPAFLSVTGNPVTSSGTLAVSLSGTALPVLNGGTGTTTSTGTGSTVLSASPTFTGAITSGQINATISSTLGSGAINLVNTTASDGPYLSTALAPNMVNGNSMYQNFGVAQSLNNSWVNWFNYASTGSTSNSLNWGAWAGVTSLSLFATGQLSVPTNITSTSTTTGSIVTPGGVGVGGKVSVGGNVDVLTGTVNAVNCWASSSLSSDTGTTPFTYREGSWTPTISIRGGGGAAATFSYTGGSQVGTYVKVGKMVTVSYALQFTCTSATVGSTNALNITLDGLPFSSSSNSTAVLIPGAFTGYTFPFALEFYTGTQWLVIPSGSNVGIDAATGIVNAQFSGSITYIATTAF